MSTKTSSKKTTATKSSKKTSASKKPARKPTLAEQADAFARKVDSGTDAPEEFTGKTRAFAGATLPVKSKKAAAPKAEKEPRVTVTSVAEGLIRDGKTDEQVLEALSKEFSDFDAAKKKHYPSWYRARLVRTGAITQDFANEHRHAKVSSDIPNRAEA